MKRYWRHGVAAALTMGAVWTCGVDDTLRAYLRAEYWMPFFRNGSEIGTPKARRLAVAYAGMTRGEGESPLAKLRQTYQCCQNIHAPGFAGFLAAARSAPGLTAKERDEIDLLEAKMYMRAGSAEIPEPLRQARRLFQQFLKTRRAPEYASEARGWLAHIHYLFGERSAAGKIYVDELARNDSNLSRETLLVSLKLLYGRDGGKELLQDLDGYFDTAEHAAFAVQMVTNLVTRYVDSDDVNEKPEPFPYERVKGLLEKHSALLRSERGAKALAMLSMRTALRAGDPAAALRLAGNVPAQSGLRAEPDFLWMLGAAQFLAKDFAGAEKTLLQLYGSSRASKEQKAAAGYGLVGVYRKLGNVVEQLRFALRPARPYEYYSVYFANSGWDRSLLLEVEAPVEAIQEVIEKYPGSPELPLAKYSLAVRLARLDRYQEAAALFESIGARLRTRRMREAAALFGAARTAEGKFQWAKYLSENSDRIYFNDRLWDGYQRMALNGDADTGFTREEREAQVGLERRLKDEQEELWRAHLILRDVAREEGKSALGRRAAELAIRCVRRLSDRFGRQEEVAAADIELTRWLRRPGR